MYLVLCYLGATVRSECLEMETGQAQTG
jgi:hypothetical protein